MNYIINREHGEAYATSDEIIRRVQDLLDLMAFAGENGTNRLLLLEESLDPKFYDLSTGLAGEMAQKLYNYRTRLAVVGTFVSVRSNRFREFMLETNRGNQLRFLSDKDAALRWLTGKDFHKSG